jgi:hypothetical protein
MKRACGDERGRVACLYKKEGRVFFQNLKTPFNTKNAAKDLEGKKTCKDAKPTLFTLSKICE